MLSLKRRNCTGTCDQEDQYCKNAAKVQFQFATVADMFYNQVRRCQEDTGGLSTSDGGAEDESTRLMELDKPKYSARLSQSCQGQKVIASVRSSVIHCQFVEWSNGLDGIATHEGLQQTKL